MDYLIQEFCCIVSKPLSSTNRHITACADPEKKMSRGRGIIVFFRPIFCINLPSEFNKFDLFMGMPPPHPL